MVVILQLCFLDKHISGATLSGLFYGDHSKLTTGLNIFSERTNPEHFRCHHRFQDQFLLHLGGDGRINTTCLFEPSDPNFHMYLAYTGSQGLLSNGNCDLSMYTETK